MSVQGPSFSDIQGGMSPSAASTPDTTPGTPDTGGGDRDIRDDRNDGGGGDNHHRPSRPPLPEPSPIAIRLAGKSATNLTGRENFFGRLWESIKDLFMTAIGRGDDQMSWLLDGRELRAIDRPALDHQALECVHEMTAQERAWVQAPTFEQELVAAMLRDPVYDELNRSAYDDAEMIHEIYLSAIRQLEAPESP